VPDLDPARAVFLKSSRSEGANGCVEVAVLDCQHLIRDSKNPDGIRLVFTAAEWAAFATRLKRGEYAL